MILVRELRLKRFSSRWLACRLSALQRKSRIEFSPDLPYILRNCRELQFGAIATRYESWFRYLIQSDSMLTSLRDGATPRIRRHVSTKKPILMVFFAYRKLLELDALPKGQKYGQYYFVQKMILAL
jgi:hypothetical protein